MSRYQAKGPDEDGELTCCCTPVGFMLASACWYCFMGDNESRPGCHCSEAAPPASNEKNRRSGTRKTDHEPSLPRNLRLGRPAQELPPDRGKAVHHPGLGFQPHRRVGGRPGREAAAARLTWR